MKLNHLNRIQWMVCFSGFMDLFAVALLVPLVTHRAKDLGATPSQIGLVGSIYGSTQLISSPVMGQISDHVCRRTMLFVAFLGTSLSYTMMAFAGSIWLLAFSRIPCGIFKHGQSMNRLYLGDTCSTSDVSKVFGIYNSITSFGFIIGPTVGGTIAMSSDGFFKVGMLSSSLFLLNMLFVRLCLPPLKSFSRTDTTSFSMLKDVRTIPWKNVWDVFAIRFLGSLSMILFRSNFSSVLAFRFDTDAQTVGYIMSFNGMIGAATGFMVPWILNFFKHNSQCHNAFSLIMVFSLLIVTFSPVLTGVVLGFIPLCISSSVLRVTTATSMYVKGGDKCRGLVNGLSDTLTSFARAVGPAVGGFAQESSIFAPGLMASVLAFFSFLVPMVTLFIPKKLHQS